MNYLLLFVFHSVTATSSKIAAALLPRLCSLVRVLDRLNLRPVLEELSGGKQAAAAAEPAQVCDQCFDIVIIVSC